MLTVNLTVILADPNQERSKALADALRLDEHNVLLAADAASVLALSTEHRADVVVFAPELDGAGGYDLAKQLRNGPIGAGGAILALSDALHVDGDAEEVDYHLPSKLDPLQLSGLLHYARISRRGLS